MATSKRVTKKIKLVIEQMFSFHIKKDTWRIYDKLEKSCLLLMKHDRQTDGSIYGLNVY